MNDGCWYAIVRSEKTHTVACNECFGMQWITGPHEFQELMCHHAVRKDTHAGLQRMLRHAMNYGCGTQPVLTREFCQITDASACELAPAWTSKQQSDFINYQVLEASDFVCKPWVFEQTLQKLWVWICWVSSLSICLSICLCLYPSISLFVLVSNYLSMCPCIYLSVSPSMSLAVPLTISLSVRLSIYLFIYRSVCPSIYVSSYVSIYLSTYLCVYLSVYLSIDLSIYLSTYLSISLSLSISPSIYLSLYVSI